jgi:hypothetical protein
MVVGEHREEVDWSTQRPEVVERRKATCMKKYGVPYGIQASVCSVSKVEQRFGVWLRATFGDESVEPQVLCLGKYIDFVSRSMITQCDRCRVDVM